MSDSLCGMHWEEPESGRWQQLAAECLLIANIAAVPMLLAAGCGVSLLRFAVGQPRCDLSYTLDDR
jgi:hypothetical protein